MKKKQESLHRKYYVATSAAVFCGLLSTLAFASDTQDDSSYSPPKYKALRFDEDWSSMPANYGDWSDRLKKINLDDTGDYWLSLGGQFRVRGEVWRSFGFKDASTNDDEFVLFRNYYWADLHLGENLRVFAQGRSNFSTDRDLPGGKRAALDVATLDMLDGFVDYTIPFDGGGSLTLRGGRQELLFGKQRLISPLDWSNNRRTFDGGSFIFKPEDNSWKLHGFLTSPVKTAKYTFSNSDDNRLFWGMYFNTKIVDHKYDLDAYVLGLHQKARTYGAVTANEDRYTIGARLDGPIANGFAFDVESAGQFGSFGSQDIQAWMVASEVNYKFADNDWNPVIAFGFDYASGDDSSTDGDLNTFNQLFPLGHAFLGYIDIIGRQNIMDLRLTGIVWPMPKKLKLKADMHYLRRANENDALYNAGGGLVRAGGPGTSKDVGWEFDLTAKYILDRHSNLAGGYSHFFAGNFLDDVPPNDDIDFVWLQYQFTF